MLPWSWPARRSSTGRTSSSVALTLLRSTHQWIHVHSPNGWRLLDVSVIGQDARCLSLERGEHGIEQNAGTVTHGIVGRKSGLLGDGGDRDARSLVVQAGRVQGQAGDLCRPHRERDALVQLDQLREAGQRVTGVAL